MAPPRKHPTDRILDAARTLALRDGPRATTVAAIAKESGAPAGTLYHRFGNRDSILQAAWLRALKRFHVLVLEAAANDNPVEAGVGMAVAAIAFARAHPEEARLLVAVRRRDLLDGDGDPCFEEQLAAVNAAAEAELLRVTRELHGRAGARAREAVMEAVVDIPEAAVRRHTRPGQPIPPWLEESVAAAARRLLTPAQ